MTAPGHDSLPLRDYDHLPLTALGHRIRSLTAGELRQLLGYEREHANRPAALRVFEARLAELDAGQAPSPGGQQAGPDWPEPAPASAAAGPATTAPPSSPPPHGTPAQPARPKGNQKSP